MGAERGGVRPHVRLFAVALGLGTLAATTAARGAFACDDRFVIGTETKSFDGLVFDMIKLRAKAITLEAFTFDVWLPSDQGGDYALTLRHQRFKNVVLGLCPLTPPELPTDEASWKEYIAGITRALGPAAVVSDLLDSTVDPFGVRVLGGDTREAKFTKPKPDGAGATVQLHVLVTLEKAGLAFVLSGPAEEVESATQDFRFFLSRLNRET